ncbi:myotrophin [Narcine bancroftii]|uniref:myotrophin n=1 Tax=Narcine bancroftii TaxID=1343680 RepID=UPI00383146B0
MSELDRNIIWAVKNGDVEEVKTLVAKGADVNAIEVAGRRPIHFAADCGQLEVLEFLLNVGANIDAIDVHGFTALLSAVSEGHIDCVKLLLSKGANKTGKSPEGKNYFELAESGEMQDLLK